MDSSNGSVDKIKCSVSPNGQNGHHSASIEMDLDKHYVCNKSDELQVYEQRGDFVFENGKDSRDCRNGFIGRHVGTMSVTTIDPNCKRPRNLIQVIVRSFTNSTRKQIDVQRNIRVHEFKEMISKTLFDVIPCQQTLVYNGRYLEDNQTLAYYGIKSGNTIDLTARLRGG